MESDTLHLRWDDHGRNLVTNFDDLLQQEDLVDVTLACEGRTLKAHKVVLSASSSYFRAILTENPCAHPVIVLKDVAFSDMKQLVTFMYKGEVNVPHYKLTALLDIAENLKVKGLTHVVESLRRLSAQRDASSQRVDEADSMLEKIPHPLRVVAAIVDDEECYPRSKRRKRLIELSEGDHSEHSRPPLSPKNGELTPPEVAFPIVPKLEVLDGSYDDITSSCVQMDADSVGVAAAVDSEQQMERIGNALQNLEESVEAQPFELCNQTLLELNDKSAANRIVQSNCKQQNTVYVASSLGASNPSSNLIFVSNYVQGVDSVSYNSVVADSSSIRNKIILPDRCTKTSSMTSAEQFQQCINEGGDQRADARSNANNSDSFGSPVLTTLFPFTLLQNLLSQYFTKIDDCNQCRFCDERIGHIRYRTTRTMKSHLMASHAEVYKEYVMRDKEVRNKIWKFFTKKNEFKLCNLCNYEIRGSCAWNAANHFISKHKNVCA